MKKIIFLLCFVCVNILSANKNIFNLIQTPSYKSKFFKNNINTEINNNLLGFIKVKDLKLHKINLKNSVVLNQDKFYKGKKEILIFTSTGGGGHTAVSNALNSYLNDNYNITIVNFFNDVMQSLDNIKTFTFGKISSEDFYNFCLKYRFIKLVNIFTKLGGWILNTKYNSLERATYNFVNKAIPRPDLIISVIPMVNNVILSVAKKLNVPFLVITNDLDTVNYVNGISKIDYEKFYYTLAFEDNDIIQKIESANVPKEQIIFSGFPLRPDFFDKKKNKEKIFSDFGIPKNKNKVMILMGGAGSYATYRYVKELSTYKDPIHIIACLGRDENIAKLIDTIKLPHHITISKVGFTSRISDLMSISQVIITKSGPGSICEAIASKLPMIVDKTNDIIRWENLNIDFVKKYNLGSILCNIKDLNNELDKLLNNLCYRKDVKKNIDKLNCKMTFENNIKNIVYKIIT